MSQPLPALADELNATFAASRQRVPPELKAIMEQADADLVAMGTGAFALKSGEKIPPVVLPDHQGETIDLAELLERGPVIVIFYRGGWCPYCNLTLRAYQRLMPLIEAAGGSLVAITPELPDHSLNTAEKNALEFHVLSDIGSTVADAFGIAFTLPEPLQAVYAQFGNHLPELNGDGAWRLPIPATFVVAPDGTIVLADVDLRYQRRLEPTDALRAVSVLTGAMV